MMTEPLPFGDPPPCPRRILVATDFSPSARTAFDRGVALAAVHGAALVVMHALDLPAHAAEPPGLADAIDRELASLATLVAEHGATAETRSVRAGRPWEAIAETAREIDADVVILGGRGRTPSDRVRLGRVADRAIRACAAPVLTVPEFDAATTVGTIVAGVDFSPMSARALHAALGLRPPGATDGRVVLVHAVPPAVEYDLEVPVADLAGALEEQLGTAREHLERWAQALRPRVSAVDSIVREGYPATVIEEEASAAGADLIALGTHGRSGLGHLLLGSVAERVLHHAGRPVLTVRHPPATSSS